MKLGIAVFWLVLPRALATGENLTLSSVRPGDHEETIASIVSGGTNFRSPRGNSGLEAVNGTASNETDSVECGPNGPPSEIKIRQYIQRNNYTPTVRPVRDSTTSVEVQLAFYVEKLNELVEKQELMTITGYFGATWMNEYFSWNDTDYACVNQILLPANELWLPDICLTNSGDMYSLLLTPGHKVQIFNNGKCSFFPATTFSVFCNLDLKYFPLDEQICHLRFESWVYSVRKQRFTLGDPPIQKIHWVENEQWRMPDLWATISNTSYSDSLDDAFDTVIFSVRVERKVAYYLFNVILPSIIISCVELVIFLLPTVEIEKIPISFTCLLAYSVFQLMVTKDLPRTSTRTPLLSVYIVLQMSFIAFALVGEGFVFMCCWNLERLLPLSPKLYAWAKLVAPYLRVKEEAPSESVEDSKAEAALTRHHHAEVEINEAVSPFGSPQSSFRTNQRIPLAGVAAAFANMNQNNLSRRASNASVANTPVENGGTKSSKGYATDNENRALVLELLSRLKKSRADNKLRAKWLFIASVIDRLIGFLYLTAILATPVIMFAIMPAISKLTNDLSESVI